MSTLLESKEALRSRAADVGLSAAEITFLVDRGANSLARLAFAAAPLGTAPTTEQVQQLLPAGAGHGAVASMKRIIFEAQTLIVADIKAKVQRRDEPSASVSLSSAERDSRVEEQKQRLTGLRLRGDEEVAHSAYDLVLGVLEKDQLIYLAPERFGTRRDELAQVKPSPQLQLEQGTISVKAKAAETTCAIKTELDLVQALRRRALAFDLVGLCSYDTMNTYQSELVAHLQEQPPVGYSHVSLQQVLRADRAVFTHLAERLQSLKTRADGSRPFQVQIATVLAQPAVTFHLLPLPLHGSSSKSPGPGSGPDSTTPRRRKAKRERAFTPPSQPVGERPSSGPKGKGPGKGGTKRGRGPNVPQSLIGKAMETPGGERLCWAFNLPSGCEGAKPGEKCPRGWHLCAEPGCAKAHSVLQHS